MFAGCSVALPDSGADGSALVVRLWDRLRPAPGEGREFVCEIPIGDSKLV